MVVQTLLLEGAPALRLQGAAGDAVTVLLRGAQLISWVDAHGVERLYRSPLSPLDGAQPVRGGVPVVFPQFAARGPLPRHGFARTRLWTPCAPPQAADAPGIHLQLLHQPEDDALWPHACVCTLSIHLLPAGVGITLAVENTGAQALSFTAALHTYLAVGEVAQSALHGLLPDGAPLPLQGPLDKVFEDSPGPLQLQAPLGPLRIAQQGFGDVVVWNPGPDAGLADLPAKGYRHFACVEAAAVAQPVWLAPGARWFGAQTLHRGD